MHILETERLFLRELNPDDAQSFFDLNSDPEVIKFTGDKAFASVNEAHDFLNNYDHYKKYGFGRWAVINKNDTSFLGWCGLKYTPDKQENDIGFRFFKKYWNKGYATEAAKACLNMGFEKLSLECIVGRAMKENNASIKVLEKIGLKYWKENPCGGEAGVIYKLNKGDF